MADGIFDNLTCKPKLTIKESNDLDYIDLQTIFDPDTSQKLTLQISKSLRLPSVATSMTPQTLINYIWGWENGLWKPVDLTIPTGDNYVRFKDTATENYGDLALVAVQAQVGYNPILTWSQGMVIKKDLSVGGFVSANQGLIALGSGMWEQFEPPGAWLHHSEMHALHDIATLASPPATQKISSTTLTVAIVVYTKGSVLNGLTKDIQAAITICLIPSIFAVLDTRCRFRRPHPAFRLIILTWGI